MKSLECIKLNNHFSNILQESNTKEKNTCYINKKNKLNYLNSINNLSSRFNSTNSILDLKKSYKDSKNFFKISLSNGLTSYIIIDNQTKSDGAAMIVNAGAGLDGDLLGLAHFTEHMLFLGSKKYNNATYFVDFISSRHGKLNGKTKMNSTHFYYKIDREYFSQGFDIFSRFFIDPTFDYTYVEKEINAIHSEYLKNLQVDSRKREHVLRTLANKESLYPRFRTGNNFTLLEFSKKNNLNLTDLVQQFFDKYYVPNNMVLVIYGSKNFNFYKKIVQKTFGHLKSKNINYLTEINQPFQLFSKPSFTFYESLKDSKQLEINFPLPNIFETAHMFLKFLLSHKVKGSLWSELKNRNYILKIYFNKKKIYSHHNIFKISLILTDHGSKNIQNLLNIMQSFFDYFGQEIIYQEKLYAKIKAYYDNQFFNTTLHKHKKIKNKKVKNIFSYLQSFSENIKDFPDEHILSAGKIMNDYMIEKENLKLLSQHISLNNSIILLGMKNFENSEEFNLYKLFLEKFDPKLILKNHEKWLNTNYGTYEINYKTLLENKKYNFSYEEYFNSPNLDKSRNMNKICKSKKCVKHANKDEKNLSPMKIFSDSNRELWFKVKIS